jgi:hypothetical protein
MGKVAAGRLGGAGNQGSIKKGAGEAGALKLVTVRYSILSYIAALALIGLAEQPDDDGEGDQADQPLTAEIVQQSDQIFNDAAEKGDVGAEQYLNGNCQWDQHDHNFGKLPNPLGKQF